MWWGDATPRGQRVRRFGRARRYSAIFAPPRRRAPRRAASRQATIPPPARRMVRACRTRSVDLTATSIRTDSPPRVSFSWLRRSPPLSTTIAITLRGWDSAARETRPSLSMALCDCGDGENPKLAVMDACNYIRAQKSVTIRSGEPRTKCCTTRRQIGGQLVLSDFEKPPIYQSCLIEISMVTHHFPDSGRE